LQGGVRILAVKCSCAIYDVKYTICGGLIFIRPGSINPGWFLKFC
jgi:hypothetical protein